MCGLMPNNIKSSPECSAATPFVTRYGTDIDRTAWAATSFRVSTGYVIAGNFALLERIGEVEPRATLAELPKALKAVAKRASIALV